MPGREPLQLRLVARRGVDEELDRAVLALEDTQPVLGPARPALRAIDELVAEPLGARMLGHEGGRRRALHTTVVTGEVVFEEVAPAGERGEPDDMETTASR